MVTRIRRGPRLYERIGKQFGNQRPVHGLGGSGRGFCSPGYPAGQRRLQRVAPSEAATSVAAGARVTG